MPITEFPISTGSPGITAGPDANLWFTLSDDKIGRITPDGQVTCSPSLRGLFGPGRITPGPDGNLWFTYRGEDQIGMITPTGQVTVFPTPDGNRSGFPFDIVAGSDGNLWYMEPSGDNIGRITRPGKRPSSLFRCPRPKSRPGPMVTSGSRNLRP